MIHQRLFHWMLWGCGLLLAATIAAPPLTLFAQSATATATATPTPGPGGAILPNEKPTATLTPTPGVQFVIEDFHTEPAQPRIEEAFTLQLEIKNAGTTPAIDWSLGLLCPTTSNTEANVIVPTGGCSTPLAEIGAGESTHVGIGLRAFARDKTKEQSINLRLDLKNSVSGATQSFTLDLFFLPARTIPDEKPTLVRPFPKPDMVIQNTWTAKARSTVDELLTPVPLVINVVPVFPAVVGGPEFELVIRLQNLGEVEATNVFVNFCAPGSKFNPVGSSCQKYVPATLPPGGQAVASQTLAYKNDAGTPPPARGEAVTLAITYDFWYVEQRVQESVTQTIYVYPQFYPAATPVPAPQTPYLVVNTPVLNVRLGPGTDYPLVNPNWGVAYQGDRFLITGKTSANDWWQIDFRGVTAWVSGYYVIVWGGERIPVATNIPPAPPTAPPIQPTAMPIPNPNPVGMDDGAAPLAAAQPGRDAGMESLPAPVAPQVMAGDFVPARNLPDAGAPPFNTVSREPLVIVERYASNPERVTGVEPFELEVALRNTGQATARQLVLGWVGDQVAPLGAGTTRWLDDLAPGGVVIVSGRFLLADPTLENFIQLPLELHYTDSTGQLVSHTEQIILLIERPGGIIPTVSPAASQSERPLWLRVLLGLLGLGAEPR